MTKLSPVDFSTEQRAAATFQAVLLICDAVLLVLGPINLSGLFKGLSPTERDRGVRAARNVVELGGDEAQAALAAGLALADAYAELAGRLSRSHVILVAQLGHAALGALPGGRKAAAPLIDLARCLNELDHGFIDPMLAVRAVGHRARTTPRQTDFKYCAAFALEARHRATGLPTKKIAADMAARLRSHAERLGFARSRDHGCLSGHQIEAWRSQLVTPRLRGTRVIDQRFAALLIQLRTEPSILFAEHLEADCARL